MIPFFRKKTPTDGMPIGDCQAPEEQAAPVRDTDRDWQIIGEQDPFFGVLTDPRFHRDNLTDEARAEFFRSGEREIGALIERNRAVFGAFNPKSALDFGCGVGRLTQPLARLCGEAVGVDVSAGMRTEAEKHNKTSAVFTDRIPPRAFDWVVSFIVLQHITPEQGYGLISQLLKAVAPGGGVSLHVVFARTEPFAADAGTRIVIGDDDVWPAGRTADVSAVPPGVMIMHDYDLGRVIALFHLHGFRQVHLDHTDHGGPIGAVIHARRGY